MNRALKNRPSFPISPTHAYCVSLPNHTGSAARHIGHESFLSSHSATHAAWNTCLAEHGMRVARWPTSNASRHTRTRIVSAAAASSSATSAANAGWRRSPPRKRACLPRGRRVHRRRRPRPISRAAASDTARFRSPVEPDVMPCPPGTGVRRRCHQSRGSTPPPRARRARGSPASRPPRAGRRAVTALELAGKLAFERRRRLFSSRDRVAFGILRVRASPRLFGSMFQVPDLSQVQPREALFAAQRLGEQLVAVHPRGAPRVVSRSEHHARA